MISEEGGSDDREIEAVVVDDDEGYCVRIARAYSLILCWNDSQPGHFSQQVCTAGMGSFVRAV